MINYVDHEHGLETYIGHLTDLFSTETGIQQPFATLIHEDTSQAQCALQAIKTRLQQVFNDLDSRKLPFENELYAKSENTYLENMQAIAAAGDEAGEKIVFRFNHHGTEEEFSFISERIKTLLDWRLPGCLIRPGNSDFIASLVELDPLYIVDVHPSLLKPALDKFNPMYQRRLRKYIISDQSEHIFAELPQNQFGFCFAWNFFSIKTLSVVTKYLQDTFQVLRPGGIFAFTISNGDKYRSASLAEQGLHCYTPESKLKTVWQSIGYKFRYRYDSTAEWTYIELQRPGDIRSLRGGQALAEIVPNRS